MGRNLLQKLVDGLSNSDKSERKDRHIQERKEQQDQIVKESVQKLLEAKTELDAASSIKSGDFYIKVSDDYSKLYMAINQDNVYSSKLKALAYEYYICLTQVIEGFANDTEKKRRALDQADSLDEELSFLLERYSSKEIPQRNEQ